MSDRQLFDIPLEPITGSRFQPTGFPDIGAAVRHALDDVWTQAGVARGQVAEVTVDAVEVRRIAPGAQHAQAVQAQ